MLDHFVLWEGQPGGGFTARVLLFPLFQGQGCHHDNSALPPLSSLTKQGKLGGSRPPPP